MKNSLNQIVSGDEACKVWINSFSKLGLESSDFGDYDADFYVHIRDRVKEFYHQSLTGNCILDDPFTLEEIKLAIGRAKKGKSVVLMVL